MGGFGRGCYRFKNQFFSRSNHQTSDFNKKWQKHFLLTGNVEIPTVSHNFCSSRSKPMLSMFSRVIGDVQSLMCSISFSVIKHCQSIETN